ncbi:hypothetical protein GCM10010413_17300 [Promicromonospora sukumoe]|uniref:Uncharacterized protein n=1 Tax=Promicromonospora sukumoe TaxID=88382 RepID=A0A7W3JA54_9MICO|nr:hypothetical protein [Promicromonospora sukumoe]MBA8809050.1 hypothetical protein [Promicromonospora sukumoe]
MTGPEADLAAGSPTDTWAFLLPPGWARFPTGALREKELDAAVDEVVARAPSGDDALRTALRAAFADAGIGAVYLPTAPVAGMAVPASITESEVFGEIGRSTAEVAAQVLGEPDGLDQTADLDQTAGQDQTAGLGEPVDLDGRPGARVVRTRHDVHREGGRPLSSTREVTYVVSRDEVAGDWLVLSFSTRWDSPGTERLAATLVDFFDAVMATFRWTGPGASPVSLPERTVPGSA